MMPSDVWHGFFSFEAVSNGTDSIVYDDASRPGKIVEVTVVFRTKEAGEREYLWKDKVYCGRVTGAPRVGYHRAPGARAAQGRANNA